MKKWIRAFVLFIGFSLSFGFECRADHSEKIVVVIDPGHGGDNYGTEVLDGYEKDEAHLINAEKTYMELSGLYNWKVIGCANDNKLRTIEEINQDILKLVLENN